MNSQLPAAWDETWARLLAYRQHLPEQYEIEERLVRDYHGMVDELRASSGLNLDNFRIPSEDLRPKVISVRMGTMRHPGNTNYSKDNYCLRSLLLMKLDALIRGVSGF